MWNPPIYKTPISLFDLCDLIQFTIFELYDEFWIARVIPKLDIIRVWKPDGGFIEFTKKEIFKNLNPTKKFIVFIRKKLGGLK